MTGLFISLDEYYIDPHRGGASGTKDEGGVQHDTEHLQHQGVVAQTQLHEE